MDLLIQSDGVFQLVAVTKEMLEQIKIVTDVDCFDLCDIIRLEFTTYIDVINRHQMNDGSGYFYGCVCR
jgi:hypothetical protein|tara:strand:+ start:158 stop:364 length:207 start_codon:yes stop_codon:yes gene_type:complete